MALKEEYTSRPAAEETINDPTNPKHYWRYRMCSFCFLLLCSSLPYFALFLDFYFVHDLMSLFLRILSLFFETPRALEASHETICQEMLL